MFLENLRIMKTTKALFLAFIKIVPLLLVFIIFPFFVSAEMTRTSSDLYSTHDYSNSYNWVMIFLFSFLLYLFLFMIWLISPLGLIFTASIAVHFFVGKKEWARVVAWVLQAIVFAVTVIGGLFLLIVNASRFVIISSQSYNNEVVYIVLLGGIMSLITGILFMIAVMVSQIACRKRKTASRRKK